MHPCFQLIIIYLGDIVTHVYTLHRNFCTNIHNIHIQNSYKLETHLIGNWISILCCIHKNVYLFRKKNKGTHDACNNMGKSQKLYAEQKKPDTKESMTLPTGNFRRGKTNLEKAD